MLPTYSDDAKAALPVIARTAYKLFVYFEDKDSEPLYETIIEKLGFSLSEIRVICLQGKKSLLAQREASARLSGKDNTFYVLDKDFDDLLNCKVLHHNVHYLDRYSIENYFLENNALQEVASEEKPKSKSVIVERLNLNNYVSEQLSKLIKLAGLYVLAQEFSLSIANASEAIQIRALDSQPWTLCEHKIEAYSEEIAALLIMNGVVTTEEELSELLFSRLALIDGVADVPGKQLIDLVRFYIFHKIDIRHISRESFCFRLAKKCNFDSLNPLRLALNQKVA